MIKKLSLENFKCYNSLNLKLSNINIVSGTNSSGKSSIIQSLIHYNVSVNEKILNLRDVNSIDFIGFKEIVNNNSLHEYYSIEIDDNKIDYYEYILNDAPINNLVNVKYDKISKKSSYLYLPAMRTLNSSQVEGFVDEGYSTTKDNRYLSHFLYQIDNDLSSKSKKRMEILISAMRDLGFVKKNLVIRKGEGNYRILVDDINIENVGAGIQYVLPILVTVIFNKNRLICIENPEIHLHPSAQSILTRLIIKFSLENNNQIIVETHSDHFINSIRVLIKDKTLSIDDLKMYFINSNHNISEIMLNEFGRYIGYYEGFFDEFERQLINLL